MKYSFVPTFNYKNKSKCEVFGNDYFIDSNERILYFRNQYKEIFIFGPRKALVISNILLIMGGFILGKLI